ncbi:GTP-binding protein HflX [Vitreoscilla filiformis]|uniref:GTPase HflX n=1 Tax=Vitreoscilla filiformis TaxID=63 RepID=A0A221KI74_VITFI|nr:GTPase HflX [Vitreoscilla filiformis]ASM78500.1 GTP-binding protein HflX [Vitreoscilla filiformis]
MTVSTTSTAPADAAARAVLVGVDFGPGASFDPTLDELALLAESAGDEVVAKVIAKRKAPDPALFVGVGKADEIKQLVTLHDAHGVIFDQPLSPAQQRNLERHLGVPVADRTALILEIFAARAQSHEGKLQVELAQLQYLASRLVRRWSHLERQRGGVGHRGGPGEAQIELDRRMIDERIKSVKVRLEKVKRQRNTQRRSRERSGTFRVSLVGYTNAGKSTLFNAMVKARAYAADQLFATLDTTTRSLYLGEVGRSVSLSDTVGFIRDLPHKLVEAFQATLQEAAEADVLLHVIDAASPVLFEQKIEVERVLEEIGAANLPQILVYNKRDLLEPSQQPRQARDQLELPGGGRVDRVFVSALTGEGLDVLRTVIGEHLQAQALRNAPNVATLPDGTPVPDLALHSSHDHA